MGKKKDTSQKRVIVHASAVASGNPADFVASEEVRQILIDHQDLSDEWLINGDGVHAVCEDGLVLIHPKVGLY